VNFITSETSYPPGHFILKLKRHSGGKYASRGKRRATKCETQRSSAMCTGQGLYKQDNALFTLAPRRYGVAQKRSSPACQSFAQTEMISSDKEKDVVCYSKKIVFCITCHWMGLRDVSWRGKLGSSRIERGNLDTVRRVNSDVMFPERK
jgi:hypothetical protein